MTIPGPLTQLGRYQLQRVLGRGAMGVVYEALDPRLGRKVAIKTILKSHVLDNALEHEDSVRFEREAQAAARLNHPHIVTVFDFGEQDEVAYIVMEFIEGRELAQHFEAKQFFDRPTAVRMLCELLSALAYAHEHGVVHRDIKPANVMIDLQGRVKLTDFGVARLAESNADRTMPGTMVGTPSYMSPEQILGQAVGSRTDLFAAGIILYQFLTHEKPFTGNGPLVLHRKIINEEPVPPSVRNPDVPAVFDAIVQRAMAKNPDKRYESASAFADELKRALRSSAGAGPRTDPEITVLMPPKPRPSAGQKDSTWAALPVPAPNLPNSPNSAALPPTGPIRRSAADTLPAAVRSALTMPSSTASGTLLRPSTPAPQPGPTPRARQPMPQVAAAKAPPEQNVSGGPSGPGWSWFIGLGGLGAAAAAALLWWPAQRPAVQAPKAPNMASAPAAATSKPVPVQPAASMPTTAPPPVLPRATETPSPAPAASIAATPASAPATAKSPAPGRPAADTGSTVPRTDRNPQTQSATRVSSARCAELLQRLQLGEDLSPDKLAIFQKECKR